MEKKFDNNLITISYKNGNRLYFTSMSRAALKLGISTASVKWALEHGNRLIDSEDEVFTIKFTDGSEIPYKLINN